MRLTFLVKFYAMILLSLSRFYYACDPCLNRVALTPVPSPRTGEGG